MENIPLSFEGVKAQLSGLPAEYTIRDLSAEAWRVVRLAGGMTLRIRYPVALIVREGGTCHRVVDDTGAVHCYVAPESGKSVVSWRNKPGFSPLQF